MMYPLNPSEEQKKYLKKLKQNAMLIQFFRFFLFFAFLFLWEICARTGTIDSFIFSSPSQIAEKMAELFHNGTLWSHCWVLCARFFCGPFPDCLPYWNRILWF